MTETAVCRTCGGLTEDGFVAVRLDFNTTPVFWAPGQPQADAITSGLDIRHRATQALIARRCHRCGEVTLHLAHEAAAPAERKKL